MKKALLIIFSFILIFNLTASVSFASKSGIQVNSNACRNGTPAAQIILPPSVNSVINIPYNYIDISRTLQGYSSVAIKKVSFGNNASPIEIIDEGLQFSKHYTYYFDAVKEDHWFNNSRLPVNTTKTRIDSIVYDTPANCNNPNPAQTEPNASTEPVSQARQRDSNSYCQGIPQQNQAGCIQGINNCLSTYNAERVSSDIDIRENAEIRLQDCNYGVITNSKVEAAKNIKDLLGEARYQTYVVNGCTTVWGAIHQGGPPLDTRNGANCESAVIRAGCQNRPADNDPDHSNLVSCIRTAAENLFHPSRPVSSSGGIGTGPASGAQPSQTLINFLNILHPWCSSANGVTNNTACNTEAGTNCERNPNPTKCVQDIAHAKYGGRCDTSKPETCQASAAQRPAASAPRTATQPASAQAGQAAGCSRPGETRNAAGSCVIPTPPQLFDCNFSVEKVTSNSIIINPLQVANGISADVLKNYNRVAWFINNSHFADNCQFAGIGDPDCSNNPKNSDGSDKTIFDAGKAQIKPDTNYTIHAKAYPLNNSKLPAVDCFGPDGKVGLTVKTLSTPRSSTKSSSKIVAVLGEASNAIVPIAGFCPEGDVCQVVGRAVMEDGSIQPLGSQTLVGSGTLDFNANDPSNISSFKATIIPESNVDDSLTISSDWPPDVGSTYTTPPPTNPAKPTVTLSKSQDGDNLEDPTILIITALTDLPITKPYFINNKTQQRYATQQDLSCQQDCVYTTTLKKDDQLKVGDYDIKFGSGDNILDSNVLTFTVSHAAISTPIPAAENVVTKIVIAKEDGSEETTIYTKGEDKTCCFANADFALNEGENRFKYQVLYNYNDNLDPKGWIHSIIVNRNPTNPTPPPDRNGNQNGDNGSCDPKPDSAWSYVKPGCADDEEHKGQMCDYLTNSCDSTRNGWYNCHPDRSCNTAPATPTPTSEDSNTTNGNAHVCYDPDTNQSRAQLDQGGDYLRKCIDSSRCRYDVYSCASDGWHFEQTEENGALAPDDCKGCLSGNNQPSCTPHSDDNNDGTYTEYYCDGREPEVKYF